MSNWEILQKQIAEKAALNPKESIFSNDIKKHKKKVTNGILNRSKNIKKKETKSVEIVKKEKIKTINGVEISNEGGFGEPEEITEKIGLDCEFVGVGHLGEEDMLARVSIVNYHGKTIYDKYIKPSQKVIDYRTKFSGIQPSSLTMGTSFIEVQKEVEAFIKDKIVIGHSLGSDFGVLKLKHPKHLIRDTAKYKGFLDQNSSKTPSLKLLSQKILNLSIQEDTHDSALDAYYAMEIYKTKEKEFDRWINKNIKNKKK
uniref:RNA exonuclease 4 n=1 Tax=Parastrongyloides trichosuri TaxID=131310 RepID=A0A0N4ZLC2_PARTI